MRNLVRKQTAARLKRLEREIRGVSKTSLGNKLEDADAIHDLRVSIRRLRQELRIFKAWFEADVVKSIRRRLRKLMDCCGAVRNCDVAIEVLDAAGVHHTKLVAGLARERQRARRDLDRTLKELQNANRVEKWRGELRLGRTKSEERVEENARRLLPPMVGLLSSLGKEAARPGSTYRRMHELRLKAKRVRYTLDVFKPVYGSDAEPILESLKGLQDKLGAINDCAVTIEMIRLDRAAAAKVRRLAGERKTEFREYWTKHFGPSERMRWKAVLGAADRKN